MNDTSSTERRYTIPARWIAAAIAIFYGFAKLNGSQFTVLDSELTRPMGEVSGFWLTWYYFGYSSAYGRIIALSQIGGGLLLLWPSTSVFGALLLLPIVANIVLADIFFGIGALPMSLLLLACLVTSLIPDGRRLVKAAWIHDRSRPLIHGVRFLAAALLLLASHTFTVFVANENNRSPTPIDGEWAVIGEGELETVFFEYNRAFMAVFRSTGFRDETHHFEFGDDGQVKVWEDWLGKGRLLYEGRLLDSTRIRLHPVGNSAGTFDLRKVSGPGGVP